MFCNKCGTQLPETAKFCACCGHAVVVREMVKDNRSASADESSKVNKPLKKSNVSLIITLIGIIIVIIVAIIVLPAIFSRLDSNDDISDSATPNATEEIMQENTASQFAAETMNPETEFDEDWISLSEVDETVYIMRADMFRRIIDPISIMQKSDNYYDEKVYWHPQIYLPNYCSMMYEDKYEIPTLSRAKGDKLVTFSSWITEYKFRKVVGKGYCVPLVFVDYNYGFVIEERVLPIENFADVRKEMLGNFKVVDEINGVTAKEFEGLTPIHYGHLESTKFIITAPYNTEFSFGFYEGTQYNEYVARSNATYFLFGEEITLPVEKTKDGYFFVDTSGLEPGMYQITHGVENMFEISDN